MEDPLTPPPGRLRVKEKGYLKNIQYLSHIWQKKNDKSLLYNKVMKEKC